MISLSELDTQRFGIKTARANDIKPEDISLIEAFCQKENVEFLIARCDASNIETVHRLEEKGCQLMDSLVYYQCNPQESKTSNYSNNQFVFRYARPQDKQALAQVAGDAFRYYTAGHYHNDLRLDKQQCTELYVDWAIRLFEDIDRRSIILVAESNDQISGFLILQRKTDSLYDIVLNAVSPDMQKRGIYTGLVVTSLDILRAERVSKVTISTHLSNWAVQRVWTRLGFEMTHASYTFHKWYV